MFYAKEHIGAEITRQVISMNFLSIEAVENQKKN